MRAVGDDDSGGPPPAAVIEHVLTTFDLRIAKLAGGSNSGAYVGFAGGLTMLAMLALDEVGEQAELYDVYGFEDQVLLEGDLEVHVFTWMYTLPSHLAMSLWPALVTDPRSGGRHRRRRRIHRAVPFFLTAEFGTDLHALTTATGMTREELVEQAVFDTAEALGLLDLVTGLWARQRLRARRGAEPAVGRNALTQWELPMTSVVSAGETALIPCWPGYPAVAVAVGAACPGTEGVWLCVTHDRQLPHAVDIETHASTGGEHRLGWLCREHGLETSSPT